MSGSPDKSDSNADRPSRARAPAKKVQAGIKPLRSVGKKQVLGWKESVLLSTLGGIRLLAKLDTGARTSALHAVDIIYIKHRSAIWVEFDLPDIDQSRTHRFRLPLAEHRSVKSSIGSSQIRPVILLELSMAGQTWSTEVTLTDRSDMELPMLIGRSALKGRFVVDPARTRLAGHPAAALAPRPVTRKSKSR
ncbi:MAG TPA: RimK/LysX family protein [Dokdonella sp.]|uniref:ATP-dependent zinc protease family protein n=1 Tax=Dokdonella sp. TaxID=2291710 RepID=UPI002D810CE7|nr:RimK/LysX family protein [Dokdonella sp.]HET9033145.1 RimK/LysX family protein [Dokdonella sp.]